MCYPYVSHANTCKINASKCFQSSKSFADTYQLAALTSFTCYPIFTSMDLEENFIRFAFQATKILAREKTKQFSELK